MVGENRVKVRGQLVTARVDVDRGIEGSDEKGLFDAPLDPIALIRQYGLVFLAKVVAVVTCMLQHCRLVFAKSVGCSGSVFLETGSCGPFGFAYVYIRAWLMVDACTWLVIYKANFFFLFQFVLRFD